MNTRTLTVIGIILIGVFSRLIPHPPNVTPVLASAIFAGAFLSNRWMGMFLPVAIMFVSDLIIGFHPSVFFVYGSLMAAALIGSYALKKKSAGRVILVTAISTAVFFLVTNFSTWLLWGMYPMDFAGLMLCYEMALPFLRDSAIANFAFVGILFGAFSFAEKKLPRLQTS